MSINITANFLKSKKDKKYTKNTLSKEELSNTTEKRIIT